MTPMRVQALRGLTQRLGMACASMKRLFRKMQAAMTAAAFAEEGEVETARRMADDAAVDEPER